MDLSLTFCYLLLRFVIPLILGSAVILRQNLFSSVYLILLFVGPLLPTPNSENVLKGANGVYLKLIIVLSSIINSAHIIFQVVLLIVSANYNTSFDYCSLVGQIYNLIGFQRYNGISVLNILRLCCLDFIILILTCMIYAFCIRSYTAKLAKDSSRENLTKNEAKRIERERRLTEAGFSVESISSQLVTKQILEKQQQLSKKKQMKEKADRLTYYLTESIFCVLLFAASILEPSLTSSVYFIYFLFIGSWFALNRHFGMGYHYFRIFIALYVTLHLSILFVYQIQIVQPIIPPDNINARLFGFVDFFNETCSEVRSFDLNSYHFVRFLHPFILILLYFVSINLIRSVLISKKYLSLLQDERARAYPKVVAASASRATAEEFDYKLDSSSNHHSVVSTCTPSAANTPNLVQSNQPAAVTTENQFSLFFSQMVNMIKRGSYVITLIVMMTWSITYHSWLSFALLLSSCIIWMMPNSRQACLNSSPILVAYAILLVVGQYVYSLNLNDEELPVSISNVSISEIGFKKYGDHSYQPLFIKIFYTLFFWITLRQYTESRANRIKRELDQGLLSPLYHIGYDTFNSPNNTQHNATRHFSLSDEQVIYHSKIFDSLVLYFKELLIKYWIWVVATMLMVMSLSGSKVVIYRIVYMFLFLTFTLLFQLSLKWWRKFIYPFWLIVILYSMIILIAIYTYQFNNFPQYWQDYLHINLQLQEDLGLVVYDNDAFILFKELLTPTFFIIITIIQVHFVHKDFLEFSNFSDVANQSYNLSINSQSSPETNSSDEAKFSTKASSLDQSDVKLDIDLKSQPSQSEISSIQTVISKVPRPGYTEIGQRSPEYRPHSSCSDGSLTRDTSKKNAFFSEMKVVGAKCISYIHYTLDKFMTIFWRILEVHILKFVFLCAIIISITDISAMNVLFVFLTVFLMVFSKFENVTCFMFGMWAGILILLKMLFQLNFAQQIEWHTNCTIDIGNNISTKEIDNRIYIGFLKQDDIFNYTKEYIMLIVILVFRSVIMLRQHVYRNQEYGTDPLLEGIIFPKINRISADKDFAHFVKYIVNFGFYKFGVEICLIFLTISISKRGDIFSVLYCIWILLFVLLNRNGNHKMWPYFVGFLAIVLPYQYLMCLGIPPGLCISYPWTNFLSRSEREWYFLPDFDYQLQKDKLYLDFAVLFFACRQLICFRLEPTLTPTAGSNLEAHKDEICQNVPDFFSFGNSIFDSIKSFFFFCFFWLTLAVLFLTGTTRINLFGLGYVLGSFIFLWNGNEFYLKPIKLIFKLWKSIIAFTCITMLLKSIIQLFVIAMLKNNLCWLIQLLGVSYYEKAAVASGSYIDNLMKECKTDEAGLLWDGICFTFLLIQKRIFCSHYFKHLVREIKAQHFLASRGAELIHEIQAKEVAEQELAEKEVMEKIKQKMDRIKAAQQKMFADKAKSIKYHKQAVKSGGYYMFEDLDSDVVDLNYNTRESLIPDPEGNEIRNLAKSKGFTTFCSKIFKGEQDAALVSAEATDIGESSKDSPIVSVERPKYYPDMSKPTTMTSIVSTSQATDISNMTSLVSHPASTPKKQSIVKSELPCITDQDEQKEEECEKDQTYMEKISNWFDFIKGFFASIFISATSSLNSVSRDYRFVAKRLSIEKKCLKKIIEIEESHGNIHDFISDQNWRKSALMKLSCVTEETLENIVKSDPELAMFQWNDLVKERDEGDKDLYYGTLDPKFMEISIYIHFFRSIFYAILSRSEVICYITIVINQITSASILSLPLPLFAFLWGSLSVPRPSKSFWVTSITYIEVMVVIKYVFQFQFWPWSIGIDLSPFWWPRLIGIERKINYANYDLLLLLVLFFHRFMLKGLGLWDLSETEVKAYMTNAELIQNEIENKESSSENGKKNKVSRKEKRSTKGKSKMDKSVDLSDSNLQEQAGLNDCQDLSVHSPNQPIYAVITEDGIFDFDDEDGDSNTEFNAIYFLMKVPQKTKQRIKSTINPVIKFFHNVLHPPYRITHDVYSLMFLCDFINFFILVFGFYAFGSGYSGNTDVAIFLEENKIPIGFLFTLLIQFAQIIIDRAIYLRKYIKGKLIFQIIIVIFTHMWLFFVLPAITGKEFTHKTNLPPKLWYIFKCIYFLLSAYQIRSGYPTRILGNTFCKKYNFVNWYLFKIYMLIPFVYDLRMYMDWIWTDTSLVLDEWSLMEDIFVNLYQRKCELKLDEEFPEPRGKAKKRFFKYLIGGSWVAIIIALIWGPLGLFAFGRAVGEVNPPIGATIELEIGGFQPLFKMSVTGSGLEPMDDAKWNELKDNFNENAIAQAFISGYDQRDVYVVNLNGNSTAVWGISPPSQDILQQELLNNRTLSMKITYYIMRKKQTKTQDMDTSIYDEYLIKLDPVRDFAIRKQLAAMISYTDKEQIPVIIPNIFPNYLRVPEKGKPTVVDELLHPGWNKTFNYRNIQILLKKGNYENGSLSSWWEIHDDCNHVDYLDGLFQYILQKEKCQYLPIVLFNDKVFIGLLAFLSGYGIIGIYTTFVFLVSRWVRGLNSESSFKVIYTRMPNVDRVLQLCLDIYLVRESREFELEEDLYAKLIFLYRSPETLIKWTKTNEELSPTPKKTIVVQRR